MADLLAADENWRRMNMAKKGYRTTSPNEVHDPILTHHAAQGMARHTRAPTREMMAISFMTMFSAGPDVSFSGSPTVSPMTAALWAGLL